MLPGLVPSLYARGFPLDKQLRDKKSITTPFLATRRLHLRRPEKQAVHYFGQNSDQGISLAIEFDEVANGKGSRTDEIFFSHNKITLLARLRNGST